MSTTITVKVSQDKDGGTDEAMQQTLALLMQAGQMPTKGVTFTIECFDEETGREIRDELKVVLAGRPVGIEAKVTMKTDEDVDRQRMVKVTPMDKYLEN
jgi:hypothetical protein